MALLAHMRNAWASVRGPRVGRSVRMAMLGLVSSAVLSAALQAPVIGEYKIKAVFLFNFAEFVEWPADSFPSGSSPLVIGIVGDDPFGSYLDEAVKGETINNRTIVIQRYGSAEEVSACQILFVSRSKSDRVDGVLDRLRGRPILTVSDMDNFTQHGGMIWFVMENNKVRLRINVRAIKGANLTISSKLLRPAEVVSMRRN